MRSRCSSLPPSAWATTPAPTGYPAGDITAKWETMQLAAERGRAFSLDRMDNEETLGLVLGNLIREWMRVHVAPELDAYRFRGLRHGRGQLRGHGRRAGHSGQSARRDRRGHGRAR
jgi:hypothetical protein